ncbi:MAG: hypothetical protein IKP99_05950 [Bacteroidales bacterium]|nr:hypothetical protein [Bacteroidales bacterium]
MKAFYNCDVDTITLTVTCPKCGNTIEETIEVPTPNFGGKNAADSEVSEDFTLTCGCGRCYEGTVYSSMNEGNIDIQNVSDDNIEIEENYSDNNI